MKIFRYLCILIFTCFITSGSFAQKDYEKAEDAFKNYEYYKAIDFYKKAFMKLANNKPKQAEVVFKISECYRKLNLSPEAELWYKKAIMVKYPDPVTVLYYADMLKMNGKYDEAFTEYQKYIGLVPDDPRGKIGVESTQLVQKWKDKPTRYEVENMAFFNSKDADYCPVYVKKDYKEVYFTSAREGTTGAKFNYVSGQNFSDIFGSSTDRKGVWSVPVPIQGGVNTENDEGVCSTTLKAASLFFTRCKVMKKEDLACKIYEVTKRGVVWGDPEELILGSDSFSYGHPAISPDELTLFFASNMPGGYGGNDIWMVKKEKKGGAWSKPVNLGVEINSSGNEVFPSVRENSVLYFSSDYHPGMGGLDIFKATIDKKSGRYVIDNLRSPINSESDDFGICYEGNQEKGFLTSKRRGGKGMEDIWKFYLPAIEFNLLGVVKDEKTEQIVPGATVKLVGSDGSSLEAKTEADGSFKFKLNPQTDYQVETSKDNYLKGKGRETTKPYEDSKEFKMEIFMRPIIKTEAIELPNIFYDFAKATLRPESMVSLDKLVEILNDNPTITIELASHTDFRGKAETNIKLSQARAQSVVDYLISKGITSDRMTAKGWGFTKPNKVSKKMADKYPNLLQEGAELTEEFIKALSTVEEQEVAHQINRRTEFTITSTDYQPKPKSSVPDGTKEEGPK
ncbi:MAG: OmpA family protein [Bacteroidia bacterium]|nr:OmpA family protein [Bacteroidia bacterium]